jgi:two-component system sensor histidine kinase KdpD
MDIAPDLPLVMVDPRLFHHCLINLIENAVRHGGEEGAITLAHSAARKDST